MAQRVNCPRCGEVTGLHRMDCPQSPYYLWALWEQAEARIAMRVREEERRIRGEEFGEICRAAFKKEEE